MNNPAKQDSREIENNIQEKEAQEIEPQTPASRPNLFDDETISLNSPQDVTPSIESGKQEAVIKSV